MGYVYLIGNTTYGWYKIGKSKAPDFRFSSLVINCPVPLERLVLTETTDMNQLETLLHTEFTLQRLHGEWFTLSTADIERYKFLVEKYRSLTRAQLKEAHQKIKKDQMLSRIQESVRKSLKIKSKRHASSL